VTKVLDWPSYIGNRDADMTCRLLVLKLQHFTERG